MRRKCSLLLYRGLPIIRDPNCLTLLFALCFARELMFLPAGALDPFRRSQLSKVYSSFFLSIKLAFSIYIFLWIKLISMVSEMQRIPLQLVIAEIHINKCSGHLWFPPIHVLVFPRRNLAVQTRKEVLHGLSVSPYECWSFGNWSTTQLLSFPATKCSCSSII